jgi:hypothetical protein
MARSKKKPAVKPAQPNIVPNDVEEFQRAYGPEWMRILQMPAFRAGLQLLSVRKLDALTNLSNEQLDQFAVPILAELIGQLKHENDLCSLHEAKVDKFPWDETEEYFPPEQITQIEELKNKLRQDQEKARYGS